MGIGELGDQRGIEVHLETVMNNKKIYSTDSYSIYSNGIVGKKLIGLTTADVICDLVKQINQLKEYAQKSLNHIDNDCEVAARLVLRKMIKGEELGKVVLDNLEKESKNED